MVVLDYELNLSKTEYLYYLECPQKFRLHRILNPIPSKTTFMNTKRSSSNYVLRGYQDENLDGIISHSFFETFHRKYYDKITEQNPPEEIANHRIKSPYWDHQQKKYFEDTDHWAPVHTELRLMTERQRGIIDCVEFSNTKKGFKLIDYKPEPSPNDKQSLIFYLNLCNEFRKENKDDDRLLYDIVEIGCYYYQTGEERIFDIQEEELNLFEERMKQIILEIKQENLPLNRDSCVNCNLKMVCKIEESRRS